MAVPPELTALRAEVDRVDLELLDVLARRREIVARIASLKHARGLAGHDPAREADMLRLLLDEAARRGVPGALVSSVLDAILEDSRGLVR
jgi:chorismate mutase